MLIVNISHYRMIFEVNFLKLVGSFHLSKLSFNFIHMFLVFFIEKEVIIEGWNRILILMRTIFKRFDNSAWS